jgi:hypothetical protein
MEMVEQLTSWDEADNEYWEYLVEVKTAGYHQALRDVHKHLVQYAFSSHACSKVFRMCPTAFIKRGKDAC